MRYRLLKAHRIDRVPHPIGSEVDLPAELGAWLVDQGVFEALPISPMVVAERAINPPEFPYVAPTALWGCCGSK